MVLKAALLSFFSVRRPAQAHRFGLGFLETGFSRVGVGKVGDSRVSDLPWCLCVVAHKLLSSALTAAMA